MKHQLANFAIEIPKLTYLGQITIEGLVFLQTLLPPSLFALLRIS